MNYTNQHNISLALAVFLATDDYDYEPNVISATTLLKPLKQIILAKRVKPEDKLVDISQLVSSRMGTAIHTAIEKAWTNPQRALKLLGYPDSIIERIVVNPKKPKRKDIPVYMEIRSYKEVNGVKVSGKFDFVAEGKVQDFKSTSVYTYLNQTNAEKYALQGSIYRWLNPDKITADVMNIHYIFTDWNKAESLRNDKYPPMRVHTQSYPLMSLEETQVWVERKLQQIEQYLHVDEEMLPPCTDEDLWRKESVWKYYKDPNKTERSTKNFDNPQDALIRLAEDGNVGIIKEVKGQVSACKYCPAFTECKQKDLLIATGELVI